MTILDDLFIATLQDRIDAMPVDEDIPDMYQLGRTDCEAGAFRPPSCLSLTYDDYIRGWNDSWAKATGRTLIR